MWSYDEALKPPNCEFCEGCCYNNSLQNELNCDKMRCCYIIRHEAVLHKEL